MNLEDQDVTLAQQGDDAAFARLYNRYACRITKYLFRYTKDYSEAEDITQEAMIRAYNNLGKFRGDCKFQSWLTRIAINESKTHWEKMNRRPPRHDVPADSFDRGHDETPESLYETEEMRLRLEEGFSQIDADFSDALQMRLLHEMPYDDIASHLDLPTGTVRSRIFRGKRDLNKYLQQEE